jgi:hypothetical protein
LRLLLDHEQQSVQNLWRVHGRVELVDEQNNVSRYLHPWQFVGKFLSSPPSQLWTEVYRADHTHACKMNLWQVHVHNNVCGSVKKKRERSWRGFQNVIVSMSHVSSRSYGTSIQIMGKRGQVFRIQSGYKVERAAQHL